MHPAALTISMSRKWSIEPNPFPWASPRLWSPLCGHIPLLPYLCPAFSADKKQGTSSSPASQTQRQRNTSLQCLRGVCRCAAGIQNPAFLQGYTLTKRQVHPCLQRQENSASRKSLTVKHPGCILLQAWSNFACPQQNKQMVKEGWTDEWVNLKELSNSLKGMFVFYANHTETTDNTCSSIDQSSCSGDENIHSHLPTKLISQFPLEISFLHLQFRKYIYWYLLVQENSEKPIHLLNWFFFLCPSDLRTCTHSPKEEGSLHPFAAKLAKMHTKKIMAINNSFLS